MNHHQLKRRDSVWLTSQQMTDLPTPTDEYNGWPDKIFQMLRYTIYRAISESDDAKGQKDAQSLVAGASNSSSSSSRSGSLTVRSHGVTTQIQQIITFQIQKAMDDVLSELALMEQAMYSQLQFDPVMRPANHQYFYAWHEAVIGVRRQFVSVIQKKSTRFKTWKALLQELEQKGWSTDQDIQCVTQIHNDVTSWVWQLKSRVVEEGLADTYSHLRNNCMLSIAKLTDTDRVRVINISPFEEVKFEMRAIFWEMVSICDNFCRDCHCPDDEDLSLQDLIQCIQEPSQSDAID